jgi:glycosyltransferase involved in cell wall biosynthesis
MLNTVSVVIPAFNCAATIQEAVATARGQTHRPMEIIVVDDASTDDTLAKLEKLTGPDLVILRNTHNAGGAASRNRGIDAARGDVIAFLDADDLWDPWKLERQLAALNAAHAPAFCFTAVVFTNEYDERRVSPRRAPKQGENVPDFMLKHGNLVQTSTIMAPRVALDGIRFTESLRRYQDIDFVLRLDAAGLRALYIDTPLVEWRHIGHATRVSKNPDPKVMREFLAHHGERLTLAQRLGHEMRSLAPRPGVLGAVQWSWRLLLSVGVGALAARNALSLLLKHTIGVRHFGVLRDRFGVGS